MLRFLFRVLGLLLLGAAVAAATVDGARSIAASDLMIASVAETWTRLHAPSLSAVRTALAGGPGLLIVAPILALPTALVTLVLGALLLLVGIPRQRRDLLEDPL